MHLVTLRGLFCIYVIACIAFVFVDSACSFVVVEHHFGLLDMESKLDSILKEFQN